MIDSINKIIDGLQELNEEIEFIKSELQDTKVELYSKQQDSKQFKNELIELINRYN